ncbi:MAG: glutathione S-transferase family protein [Rhodospirillales bacterium]|nr:glutathione S-transferase family protein [Rhodospirillales bacterium]
MIKLIQFPPAFGLPNSSPFCIKAELLLKMASLPYEIVPISDPRKGPKGKLPAIEDGGKTIGDSEFIRRHFEHAYGVDFDKGLGSAERAVAHAFARAVEERTYWVLVYDRWINDRHWPTIRKEFFGGMPAPIRNLVAGMIRGKVRRALHGHGMGRHAPDEIYALGVADMRAIADFLADKPFLMGAEPTGADASVYPIVACLIDPPFDSPPKAEALRHANLVAYAARMRSRYFA